MVVNEPKFVKTVKFKDLSDRKSADCTDCKPDLSERILDCRPDLLESSVDSDLTENSADCTEHIQDLPASSLDLDCVFVFLFVLLLLRLLAKYDSAR